MPWAPEDWRGSSVRGFAVMNGDHVMRLVYLELLFYFWTHGGTHPSDPLRVAATVGIPPDEAAGAIADLVGLGALDDNGGVLSNVRVTNDLREDAEFREERARAGSKGGQKASSAQATASSAQAQLKQPQAQHDPPSPSPSPSPSPMKKEEEHLEPAAPSRRPGGAIGVYHDAWEERYGAPPRPSAKDCVAANSALKPFSPEERDSIVRAYLADEEPWILEQAHRLGHLPGRVDRLRAKLAGKIQAPTKGHARPLATAKDFETFPEGFLVREEP